MAVPHRRQFVWVISNEVNVSSAASDRSGLQRVIPPRYRRGAVCLPGPSTLVQARPGPIRTLDRSGPTVTALVPADPPMARTQEQPGPTHDAAHRLLLRVTVHFRGRPEVPAGTLPKVPPRLRSDVHAGRALRSRSRAGPKGASGGVGGGSGERLAAVLVPGPRGRLHGRVIDRRIRVVPLGFFHYRAAQEARIGPPAPFRRYHVRRVRRSRGWVRSLRRGSAWGWLRISMRRSAAHEVSCKGEA